MGGGKDVRFSAEKQTEGVGRFGQFHADVNCPVQADGQPLNTHKLYACINSDHLLYIVMFLAVKRPGRVVKEERAETVLCVVADWISTTSTRSSWRRCQPRGQAQTLIQCRHNTRS